MDERIAYEVLIQGILELISCVQFIIESTERVWLLRECVLIPLIGNRHSIKLAAFCPQFLCYTHKL
jgi:hypothetical protein